MNHTTTPAPADKAPLADQLKAFLGIWGKGIKTGEEGLESERAAFLMLCLAFVIGVAGGFGAIAFKAVIAFFHNLFFYGRFGLHYNSNVHMDPSPWGALVILVPVAGAAIVTWVIKTLAPEARGHGVPEVLNAIYYRDGKIRPVVVVAKALASAISIGTGGSVGREGPIVQIGSAVGSLIGQVVNMPVRQRNILIAAGAAAGIGATFNAPIGGLAFAVELLLVSISARTVTLVAISTVTATYIGRLYEGLGPSFDVPKLAVFEEHLPRLYALLLCVPLGVLAGVAAAVFIRSIYVAEDWFSAKFKNDYLRHMLGMAVIGLMLYLFMQSTGHYYVGGVGYAAILDILNGTLTNPGLLALLFIGKLLATDVTIGSGASGGVFSPALFLGATLGATYGNLVSHFLPSFDIYPVVYAIAGMAAMVGGTTGAVLTAIIMTFEQTRDYSIILVIIMTVSLAHIIRVKLCPESIYTLKLMRRGMHVPQGLQAATSHRNPARRIMSTDFHVVDIQNFAEWQADHRPGNGPRYTVFSRDDKVLGLARDELLYILRDEDPEIVIDKNFFPVLPTTRWPVIMRGMRAKDTETVLVFRHDHAHGVDDVVGIITPRELTIHAGADAQLLD